MRRKISEMANVAVSEKPSISGLALEACRAPAAVVVNEAHDVSSCSLIRVGEVKLEIGEKI
jgi:hypothetical protein